MSGLWSMLKGGNGQATLPAQLSPQVPNTEDVASLPKDERRSAKKIAGYLWDQFDKGKQRRRLHMIQWLKVHSIMRGIHYFDIRNGAWVPLRKPNDPRVVWATYPIMEPFYRREHGRLSENDVGVTARPITGRGHEQYYLADRANAVMSTWTEEADLSGFYDEHNQHLLYYGLSGMQRYVDEFRKQVLIRSLPGCELFPVPYDATSPAKADGIIHATVVSKQWLEMQDAIRQQANPGQPLRSMAKEAETLSMAMDASTDALAVHNMTLEKFDGAVVLSIWMKPNRMYPEGEFIFMVNDQMFTYWNQDQEGVRNPMPGGKIPIEFVYYEKKPNDFWGTGFLQSLVPMQLEANRQLSSIVRSAMQNRPMVFYDSDVVDSKDIMNDVAPAIPMQGVDSYDTSRRDPVFAVASPGINRDVGTMMGIMLDGAKQAAAHESDIIRGQQEGRTEGGPATNRLYANAQIPLQPVVKRQFEAFKRTYPAVLDLLKEVWPNEKRIRAAGGPLGVGRELLLKRDQLPTSEQVVLTPTPLIPGGRTAMMQLLFELRQMPAPNGGFELDSDEFRKALRMLNINPPGVRLIDEVEERITERIARLINDGQQPAMLPAGSGDPMVDAQQQMEHHGTAVKLLKKFILAPEFAAYAPPVQQSLLAEIKFHVERTTGSTMHPDAFDDDIESLDAIQSERGLDFQEQQLDNNRGQMAPGGLLVA